MSGWGRATFGDPCAECGFDWDVATSEVLALVRGLPARLGVRLSGASGEEGASTAHAVYEGMQAWRAFAAQQESGDAEPADGTPAGPPTGVAVFAADTTIRSLMDPRGTVAHWSNYDRGGHFAAMEAPDLLTTDIRTFTQPLR